MNREVGAVSYVTQERDVSVKRYSALIDNGETMHYSPAVVVMASDYDALQQQVEALRADAERWRYARTRILWDRHGPCLAAGLTRVNAEETDRNIDTARQSGEKERG